ncbi:MAG: hypothetical protein K9M10_03900 [Candidatus Pacebacteria bacterium]|nr:hypothetical protein [Candidatus Paceibacterota bacterium]MCF7857593.1 hypothetical protein [Candidatus Paceibacterota bacterium]
MSVIKQKDKIVAQLELLNAEMIAQRSVRGVFLRGIIHGVGFFTGSAIIATIAFGLLSPFFGQIDWVRDNFERGSSLVK